MKPEWDRTPYASRIETLTDAEGKLKGMKFLYEIHGKCIAVMMSYDALAEYDQRDSSVPAEYLDGFGEAGWWPDGVRDADNAEKRMDAAQDEMEVIHNTCYHTLTDLAGPPPPALPPEKKSL